MGVVAPMLVNFPPQLFTRGYFLMLFLLISIFKYSGKTNGARASETGLSGKANQL